MCVCKYSLYTVHDQIYGSSLLINVSHRMRFVVFLKILVNEDSDDAEKDDADERRDADDQTPRRYRLRWL